MSELPESVVELAKQFTEGHGAVKVTGETPTMDATDFARHVDAVVGLVIEPGEQIEDVDGMAAWCVVNVELLLAAPDELRKMESRLTTFDERHPNRETSMLLSMVSLIRKLGATGSN